MNVTMSEALSEYERWLRAGDSFAEGTIRNRLYAAQQLADITGDIKVKDITPKHIEQLRTEYQNVWENSTSNVRRSLLRMFFQFCQHRGWITESPTVWWRADRVAPKERMRINPDEWDDLLDSASWWPPYRMLLACGLYLMLRGSEVAHLRIKDVSLEDGEVLVWRKKTQRWDHMQAFEELHVELRRYLGWYADKMMKDWSLPLDPDMPLIPKIIAGSNERGVYTEDNCPPGKHPGRLYFIPGTGKIDPNSKHHNSNEMSVKVKDLVNDYLARKDMHLPKGEASHCLRRSGARALFDVLAEEGFDHALIMVRDWLDHKDATVTQLYIGVDRDKKKRNDFAKGRRMIPTRSMADKVVSLRSVR